MIYSEKNGSSICRVIVCKRSVEGIFYLLLRNEKSHQSSPLYTTFQVPQYMGTGEILLQKVREEIFSDVEIQLRHDVEFVSLLKNQFVGDETTVELCLVSDNLGFTPPGMIWLTLPQALKLEGLVKERKVLLLLLQYLAKSHLGIVKAVEESSLQ